MFSKHVTRAGVKTGLQQGFAGVKSLDALLVADQIALSPSAGWPAERVQSPTSENKLTWEHFPKQLNKHPQVQHIYTILHLHFAKWQKRSVRRT